MLLLSPQNLEGDQRSRWEKSRKELLRGVLRDPGSSPEAKKEAREKIVELPLAQRQFVGYPEESVVDSTNGAR